MDRSIRNSKLKVTQVLDPDTLTATGTTASFDAKNFSALMFLVTVGAMSFSASNYLDLVVQHSDDDSTWTDVGADDLFDDAETPASGIQKILDAAGDADSVHEIHYRGNKRYVRLSIEETGTVSVPIAVLAVGMSNLIPPL